MVLHYRHTFACILISNLFLTGHRDQSEWQMQGESHRQIWFKTGNKIQTSNEIEMSNKEEHKIEWRMIRFWMFWVRSYIVLKPRTTTEECSRSSKEGCYAGKNRPEIAAIISATFRSRPTFPFLLELGLGLGLASQQQAEGESRRWQTRITRLKVVTLRSFTWRRWRAVRARLSRRTGVDEMSSGNRYRGIQELCDKHINLKYCLAIFAFFFVHLQYFVAIFIRFIRMIIDLVAVFFFLLSLPFVSLIYREVTQLWLSFLHVVCNLCIICWISDAIQLHSYLLISSPFASFRLACVAAGEEQGMSRADVFFSTSPPKRWKMTSRPMESSGGLTGPRARGNFFSFFFWRRD